jgi:hypothetical protein
MRSAAARREPTAPEGRHPATFVPDHPDRAFDDDKEARPDLTLPGDDVARREVDLDRDRSDPFHPVGVDTVEQPGARQ